MDIQIIYGAKSKKVKCFVPGKYPYSGQFGIELTSVEGFFHTFRLLENLAKLSVKVKSFPFKISGRGVQLFFANQMPDFLTDAFRVLSDLHF